jgi:hypothetical protein
MSDLRWCPGCGQDRGGYYCAPPTDWQCDDCHARRIERGRQAVTSYAAAVHGDTPDDDERETHAVDLVADILHYLDHVGSIEPADILPSAQRHYDAEHLGRVMDVMP